MDPRGVVVVQPAPGARANRDLPALGQIANRAIACHVLEGLAAAGVGALAVVAPPESIDEIGERVTADLQPGLKVTFLARTAHPGLQGALHPAVGFVGDSPAIVHLADGLVTQSLDLLTRVAADDAPDLLVLLHRSSGAGAGLSTDVLERLGVAELRGNHSPLAAAGVCRFSSRALQAAAGSGCAAEAEIGLGEIAGQLAALGCRLDAAIVRGWRRYHGDPLDLLELNRLVLDRQPAAAEPLRPGDNRIEGRAIIDPTATVSSSVILGPCIIGPRARVTNSYIGPYTSVGAGAEIEGAEIVRSIISEDVRISHVSGRIEGSTIGRRATIFRDFALPRAMRLHVGEDVEVAVQ